MLKHNLLRLLRLFVLASLTTTAIPRPAELEAAVVVLANRTEQPIAVRLEPVFGQPQEHTLAPGKVLRVPVADSAELTCTLGAEKVSRSIDPDTVHTFVAKDGKMLLERINFPEWPGSRWWCEPGQGGPPPAVVVPVKILGDDEASQEGDWEAPLRAQLAVASNAIETQCGVRFEVVAAETWESHDAEQDFEALEAGFRQQVLPGPGRLAIGLVRQFQISEKHPLPNVDRKPLFTHLLLPDVQGSLSADGQLALLTHELGHFLGAVHSEEETSVMCTPLPKEEKGEKRAPSGSEFDAINTLAMSLVAEQIRQRQARNVGQLEPDTRAQLRSIYFEQARRVRKDPQPARLAEMLREPVSPGFRYLGQWTDGTRRVGDEVAPWHASESSPSLVGRPLFGAEPQVRWLLDTTIPPAGPPDQMVEFVGGDRLPGRVVGAAGGDESPEIRLPPHLIVVPSVRLDLPRGSARAQLRVLQDYVRRIVWKRLTGRYRPQTLLLRDGAELDFRSFRLGEGSVRLLRPEGIREVPLAEVAELHFPARDPWDAYFEQLPALSPDGRSRLVELETADGLRVTSSTERFQAVCSGSADDPANWHHVVQPAWSLDALCVRHRQVRVRRYFLPHEVPLSRIEPAAVRQQSDLGVAWPWQVDRSVERGPLKSGGLEHAWGFGVHAVNEMDFPLPGCARAFRSKLGLDELAGSGGCVEAKVLLGPAASPPLFSSGPLVGCHKVLDTGRLALDMMPSPGESRRLILQVDSAHQRRPAGADPLDIRDTFDWLEPLVELDPAALLDEIAQRAPRQIPAWEGWEIVNLDRAARATVRLVNYWDQTDEREPVFRLLAEADQMPLWLTRQIQIGPNIDRLLLAVSRPESCPGSKIEVRIDGQLVASLEVPLRRSRQAPSPLAVPLADYRGRKITLELIQRRQGFGALVEWSGITLAP